MTKPKLIRVFKWTALLLLELCVLYLAHAFVVLGLADLRERWGDAGHFPDSRVTRALAAAGLEWEDYACACDLDVPVGHAGGMRHVTIEWTPGRVGWRHERSISTDAGSRCVDADLPPDRLVAVIREMAEAAAAADKEARDE